MIERTNEKKWYLLRNDNGEWISNENCVFLSRLEISILKALASKEGKELHVQHGPDGSCWCYKHEVEMLNGLSENTECKPRKLRITKKYNYE